MSAPTRGTRYTRTTLPPKGTYTMADAPTATPSKLDTLKADLKTAETDAKGQGAAIQELLEVYGSEAKLKKSKAYGKLKPGHDAAIITVDKIKSNIEAETKRELTVTALAPIIEAVGEITVENARSLPATIHFVDIESKLKKAREAAAAASSLVTALTSIQTAAAGIKIDPEVMDSLKPFHFEPISDTVVKLTVASRAGRGGGGTRSGRQMQLITKAGDDFSNLVGYTVGGKEEDAPDKTKHYKTWRLLLEATDPKDFAKREVKKDGGSNYSAGGVSRKSFGLTVEIVEAAKEDAKEDAE